MDGRVVGRLVSWRGDTLRLLPQSRADTIPVAMSAVTRLEVSRGRRRPWLRGGVMGFAAGAAVGAVAGAIVGSQENCEGSLAPCGPAFGATALGMFGGVIGGLVGVSVGAARRADRWEPIALARGASQP
jgi:hypothetical protein